MSAVEGLCLVGGGRARVNHVNCVGCSQRKPRRSRPDRQEEDLGKNKRGGEYEVTSVKELQLASFDHPYALILKLHVSLTRPSTGNNGSQGLNALGDTATDFEFHTLCRMRRSGNHGPPADVPWPCPVASSVAQSSTLPSVMSWLTNFIIHRNVMT